MMWTSLVSISLVLLGLILCHVNAQNPQLLIAALKTGTCEIPNPQTFNPTFNPCARSVNYPYYLPAGKTNQDLLNEVRTRLDKAVLTSMPAACVSNLARMVCSSVYNKCVGTLSDHTTWNTKVITSPMTLPMPFSKPCKNVCTDVLSTCPRILLSELGVDLTNPPAFCNADKPFIAAAPTLTGSQYGTEECHASNVVPYASSREPYMTTNRVCEAFIEDTHVFTVNGTRLNPAFAVLLPPTVALNALDNTLATQLKNLPPWLNRECAYEMKRFACNSVFMPATTISLFDASEVSPYPFRFSPQQKAALQPENFNIIVPRQQSYQSCQRFNEVCAPLLAQANLALDTNCDAVERINDQMNMRKFPNAPQAVAVVPLPISNPPVIIPFVSQPHDAEFFASSAYSYDVNCPYTFVEPEDKSADAVEWLGFSDCALSCKAQVFTDDEWDNFDRLTKIIPVVSCVAGAAMLVYFFYVEELKDSYLLVTYAVFGLIAAAYSSWLYRNNDGDNKLCYDNAALGGQPNDDGNNACSVQGYILTFTLISCASCLLMMTQQTLHIKTELPFPVLYKLGFGPAFSSLAKTGVNLNKLRVVLQYLLLFGLPLILSSVTWSLGGYGFGRTYAWCFTMPKDLGPYEAGMEFAMVAIPLLVLTILTLITVLGQTIRDLFFTSPVDDNKQDVSASYIQAQAAALKSESNSDNNIVDEPFVNEKIFYRLVLWRSVVIAVGILFFIFGIARAVSFQERDDYREAIQVWATCLMQYYTKNAATADFSNGNDSLYDDALMSCGEYPSKRPKVALLMIQTLILHGHLLIAAIAMLLSYQFSRFTRLIQSFCSKPESVGIYSKSSTHEKKIEMTTVNADAVATLSTVTTPTAGSVPTVSESDH